MSLSQRNEAEPKNTNWEKRSLTISHHISDELLLEYASGALGEGWSIAVATHLAMCPSCRRRLSLMENAGGSFLEAIEVERHDDEDQSWAALRSRLIGDGPRHGRTPAKIETAHVQARVPEPLRSYLGGDLDTLKWKSLGVGAAQFIVKIQDGSASVRLLRIPAGKPVPEHSHGGRELTLVLGGCFRDGSDFYGAGDFEEADPSTNHQPIAMPGEDCICLAVTDAPLRFRSLLVRLIQPLLGI
jgi:putative transcriptional regulator